MAAAGGGGGGGGGARRRAVESSLTQPELWAELRVQYECVSELELALQAAEDRCAMLGRHGRDALQP